jgi:AcrR family transcriptional regulator
MSTIEGRPRGRYHHGDLHRALVEAGTRLAREGGPDAVVLREATRQVGVSANAAYRHFADRDALLGAVIMEGLAEMARTMEAELATVRARNPQTRARARLRAVGLGYVRFATAEPGLFRATFLVPSDLSRATSPEGRGASGRTPFELLSDALDELVEAGVVSAGQRPGAELLAWSAVHGLAVLAVNGPLRGLAPDVVETTTDRLLSMVDAGLGFPAPAR